MILASAPGKVVLWGEYAVLEGAPAAVLAVNRRARCQLEATAPRSGSRAAPCASQNQSQGRSLGKLDARNGVAQSTATDIWRFSSRGFKASAAEFQRLPSQPPTEPAATLAWHVLRQFRAAELPPVSVLMDTQAFFADGSKLGLGSSAALCVALEGAFAALAGGQANRARALAAHKQAQGGLGSGIDVAASFFGGCLRFQQGEAAPCPDALMHRCFVWTGEPAQTAAKLGRLREYLRRGERIALDALAQRSEELSDRPTLDGLAAYAEALRDFDAAAQLGIHSAPHSALQRLAGGEGLIYKPCGAGGGDLGMAVGESPQHLVPFRAAAQASGFKILELQAAKQGIQCSAASP